MTRSTSNEAAAHGEPLANRYDRLEWAGAFGDLGTLVPFLLAYLAVLRMDAAGVLLGFGLAMIASGLYYRTPFPVQPMKAIGAAAALQGTHAAGLTPATVTAAAIVTGMLWLAVGWSGLAGRLARLVPASVVSGIVLGLGCGFMLEGLSRMSSGWMLAATAAALAYGLRRSRSFPAMFALLVLGLAAGSLGSLDLARSLLHAAKPELPHLTVPSLGWHDLLMGAVMLALPQAPMTLGNAIIAISDENNRLFPHAPVTERKVAISTGLINLMSGAVGGVPMCHGAGGMAGHVAFGARTGGCVVILGSVLLVLGLFFSRVAAQVFALLSPAVLGVILAIAGWQLARGGVPRTWQRSAATVTMVTAAIALWNVAAAFVIGVALSRLARTLDKAARDP
jgi:MFS superfamily sulfate permease-like transporter